MGIFSQGHFVRVVATLTAVYDLHVMPKDISGVFTEICMKKA